MLISIVVLFIIACDNTPKQDRTTTAVTATEKSIPTIEEQVKNSLLANLYLREVLTIKGDELYFSFKFDLNSDAGEVPDTYGSHLNFNFKVEEQLIFPKKIAFEEEGFTEEVSARLEHYEGVFTLIAVKDDLLIYNSLKPQRALVLFKDGEQAGALAYYFNGEENPKINEANIYEVIEQAYEEGDMVIEHSRSSMLSTIKEEKL